MENRLMWKKILTGIAVLTLAGATTVSAQRMDRRADSFRRGPPATEDMQAFADARLAALRAGLALTAAQAVHWPAFEQAVREWQKLRADRAMARGKQSNEPTADAASPADRLRRRATAMSDTGAAMKKLADAVDPLYASLDDAQKRRFAALSRLGAPRDGAMRGERRGSRYGSREFRGGHHGHGSDEDRRGGRFGRGSRGG
jgi:hypothetical protein